MRILALDIGTQTGWALWDGRQLESGAQTFALERGESPGMRFLRFNRWLDVVMGRGLELVVWEKPPHLLSGHALDVLVGMATRLEEACARLGVQHATVHAATLKKFATGKGNAGKLDMLDAAVRRWTSQFASPGYRGAEDQADALWVLEWARSNFDVAPGGTEG